MEVIVLAVIASLFFASYALWKRGKAAAPEKALPAPPLALTDGDRTLQTLQIGDVVSYLGDDFIVEGVLALAEDGRTTRLYRIADGDAVRWLAARPNDDAATWLEEAPELASLDALPDTLVAADMPYRLAARSNVVATRTGNIGVRMLAAGAGTRLHLHEYVGAGRARIVAVGDAEPTPVPSLVLRGEHLLPGSVELLPGR